MTLFLDACVVIYWVEAAEPFYSALIKKLRELESQCPQSSFAVSRLSLLECRVKPLKEKDLDLLALYDEFFSMDDLQIIEMDGGVVETATQLRVKYNLRTPDALQAASALSIQDETLFVTGDPIFKKIPELRVLSP